MRRFSGFVAVVLVGALMAAAPDETRVLAEEGDGATTREVPIATGGDDVEQWSTGYPSATSSDLELVDADESPGQTVGLRFTGLDLPRYATITEAWIQFTVAEADDRATSLTIAAEATGDAAPFTPTFGDLTRRSRTGAAVAWTPEPWTDVGSAGPASRTPDLSAVLQEVVDQPEWGPAGALALLMDGTGRRSAAAEDHPSLDPPRLHVTFQAPPAEVSVDARVGSTADDAEQAPTGVVTRSSGDLEMVVEPDALVDQIVGVRFTNLDLPRGAVIRRAWIQFTADEVHSDPTELTIGAHDVDNAPKLGPNNANLSTRNPTDASVTWRPPPWARVGDAGAAQRTPDLRALVQEVVDRPHFAGSGSALAFIIRGSGHRTAVAFDQDPTRAAALHIDYLPGDPAPRVSDTHRFGVIGDYGNGGTGEQRVAELVNRLDVDDVVTVGDNSYGSNPIDENIGRFYVPYLGSARSTYGSGAPTNRFWPALGNHEYTDGGGINAYLDYFTLPGNERYYDVVRGPVHLFFVNSNHQERDGTTADSVQGRWLRTAMAASTSPWQVVVLHHSPYSSGLEHGSNPGLQWPFASWGADLVLSGHDHDYERHEVDGTPYVVNGLGGASRYGQGTVDPHSVFWTNADDGAALLEACAGRLEISFHGVSSGVLDRRRLGGPSCNVPTVDLTASATTLAEGGAGATLTVTRSGEVNRPLQVRTSTSGTATAADVAGLPATVTIPAGADHVEVPVDVVDDPLVEDTEALTVALTEAADLDVGSGTIELTISSDDRAPTNVDLFAVDHVRPYGVVQSGNLASLRSSDNNRIVLREQLGPSSPPNSLLESRFVLPPLPAFLQATLVVEAHHSVNTEGDDLLIDWSRNGGPFHALVTVTKTADNGTAQFKLLPGWINAGDVISLRVRDANRTPGRRQLDTASVDRLFLRLLVP
jgi:hypothetical protein